MKTSANTTRLKVLLPSVSLADPHLATDSHAVLTVRRLLFETLVAFDGSTVKPHIAEKWRNDENGKRWVFTLSHDHLFPDGREVTSKDAAYSIERASSPDREGQLFTVTYQSYFEGVRIETPDCYTLVLHFPQAAAQIIELLSDIAVVPVGWKSYEDGGGSGPFEAADASSDTLFLRRRTTGHEGRKSADGGQRAVDIEEIFFLSQADAHSRLAAVLDDKAELALDPPIAELITNAEKGRLTAASWQPALCVIFFMSCDLPVLKTREVRQAINLAVDVEGLIEEVVHGRGRLLNGPLSSRHFAADPGRAPYPFDTEAARKLLKNAGYADGFQLEIHAPTSIPTEGPALAKAVAADLEKIGIRTEVILHEDRRDYARRVAEKEIRGLLCFDSSPQSSFKVLHEKLDSRFAGPWWQGYDSAELNSLIDQASAVTESAERRKIARRAFRLISEDAPWLFLYNPDRFWAVKGESSIIIDSEGFPVL